MLREVSVALMYREEAHYLERTAPWVERVSLSYIKERILDDDKGRKVLHQRFLHGQTFAQDDPWKARADGAASHEFQSIAVTTG